MSIALGALFTVMELRGMSRDRKTHLVLDVFNHVTTTDYMGHWAKIRDTEFKDGKDAEDRCSLASIALIACYTDAVALLIRRKLVDPELIFDLIDFDLVWKRLGPWVQYQRERYNEYFFENLEPAAEKNIEYARLRKASREPGG